MTSKVDSTAERIIEAAGQVFAERGFAAATIREICALAATNIASVNYYFGDKSKLYVACVLAAYRQRDEVLPLHTIDQDQLPEIELRRFIRAILCRALASDGECWQARLLLQETLAPSASTVPMLREYFRPSFEEFVGLLERLQGASRSNPKIDVEPVIYTVVSQCLFYRVGRPFIRLLTPNWEREGMELDQLTDYVTASVLGLFFASTLRGHAITIRSGELHSADSEETSFIPSVSSD